MTKAKKRTHAVRNRKPRNETSAGGVVFRMDHQERLYLLIRDSYQNWGFPKGHLEPGEQPAAAALREVREETGLSALELRASVDTIEWHFRFRGRLIHKVCHFFLMEAGEVATKPQRAEGITACKWARYDDAARLLSYENARGVLARAHAIVQGAPAAARHAAGAAAATLPTVA